MNTLQLGDSLIFLSKSLKAALEMQTRHLGIGIGQIQVLMTLRSKDNTGLNQAGLSQALSINKGNISRNVARLAEKDYVCQGTGGEIVLSLKGEAVLKELAPLLWELNRKMTRGISPEALDQCHSLITLMIKNLED